MTNDDYHVKLRGLRGRRSWCAWLLNGVAVNYSGSSKVRCLQLETFPSLRNVEALGDLSIKRTVR